MVGARGFEPPTSATPFASGTMSQAVASMPWRAKWLHERELRCVNELAAMPSDATPRRTTREQFVRPYSAVRCRIGAAP